MLETSLWLKVRIVKRNEKNNLMCDCVFFKRVYHVGKIFEPFKKFEHCRVCFFGLIFVASVRASNVKFCVRDLDLGSLPRSPLGKQGKNTAK